MRIMLWVLEETFHCKKIEHKNLLIAEASYSQGVNSSIYLNDTAAIKELDNYMLNGYFGQLVWKTDIMKSGVAHLN